MYARNRHLWRFYSVYPLTKPWISAATQLPVIEKGIKYMNIGSSLGAYTAHGVNAYRESCANRKKK